MDLESITLAGLAAVGVVNVVTFFRPAITSEIKFAFSAVAAFVVIALVPADLGNIILEYAKQALIIAFAMSGGYKIATKAGGN